MELRINIDQDQDLRKFLKDQMKGQIDALAREDLKEYLVTELERKLAANSDYLDVILREIVTRWFNGWNTKERMDRMVSDLFEQYIVNTLGTMMIEKDWTAVVEKLAQRKFESMLIEYGRK